jgi:DNA processing protein
MNAVHRQLSEAERIAWLRLARTENIGPATFASLLARFGDIHEALDAAPLLAKRGGRALQLTPRENAEREWDAVRTLSGRMIACCEPDYPEALAALDAPPPILTVLGRADILNRDMVAVVGARNASALGMKFPERMASDLGDAGLVVVSGLARGIDRAAHLAALGSGTVAVVAGGADIIYPPENTALHEQIIKGGAVVSEMALGMAPLARHFPRRNRIICGLARGVVVIEAAERSGSLITASYALEQGREVFAVPGSPLDPRAKGSNRLLREGATLTESAGDVLSALRPILIQRFEEGTHLGSGMSFNNVTASAARPGSVDDTPHRDEAFSVIDDERMRRAVEEKLSPAPVEIDELLRQCSGPASQILTILLELELAGRLARHPGARVSWR